MNTPLRFLPVANTVVTLAVTTLIFGTIYGGVQQVYRQTANDPQVQIAEDAVAQIETGADPKALVPTQPVDLAKSLDTFITITDSSGKVVASSATLDGKPPVPPFGVLTASKSGQNKITWQPKKGVRMAIVVQAAKGGSTYVILGRSLRTTEERISQWTNMAAIGWLVSVALILSLALFKMMRPIAKKV